MPHGKIYSLTTTHNYMHQLAWSWCTAKSVFNSAESPHRFILTVRFLPGATTFTPRRTPLSPHFRNLKFSRRSSSPSVPTAMDTDSHSLPSKPEPALVATSDDVTLGPIDRSSGSGHLDESAAKDLDSHSLGLPEDVAPSSSSALQSGGVIDDGEGEESKIDPVEVLRNVMCLSCESTAEGGNCDVYLIGTAHVSMESCQEVQDVISFLKPQVVFLELCSGRVALLTPQNLKVPTMGEMVDMWKKKHNMFGILYSWFLAKVASSLDVFPGTEFRVGYEEAMKYGGKVILGDRPVSITLKRTWAKMPLWHKTKLLYSLLFQTIFLPSADVLNKMLKEMDDADMLTVVIQEMSKQYPTLMETLVHERDQYMSSRLLKVASEHSSVVAVVGKGHLQGIKKHWKQPVAMKELLEIPSQKSHISAGKVFTTFGVTVAGVAIISGIYLSSRK